MKLACLLAGLALTVSSVLSAALPVNGTATDSLAERADGVYVDQSAGAYPSSLEGKYIGDVSLQDAWNTVKDIGVESGHNRGKFTLAAVRALSAKWEHLNWVICLRYKPLFVDAGSLWGQFQYAFVTQGGLDSELYTIFGFESGTFEREGDGGSINWAWKGWRISVENDGAKVTLGRPA